MQKPKADPKTQKRQDAESVINVLIGFVCAFLLTRVRLHGLHAPLAFALLIAVPTRDAYALGALGGIVAGSMIGGNPMWHTAAAACVYRIVLRVLPYIRVTPRRPMQMILFAVCGAVTLPLNALYGAKELLFGAVSLPIALLCSLLFARLIKSVCTLRKGRVFTVHEQVVFALAFGVLLLSVSDITFFGWSLSCMLLVFCTAVSVTARGVYGVAASALWASMLVLYAGAGPMLIGSIATAALLGAMLRSRGRPFVFLSFVLSSVLFETYAETSAVSMDVQNLLSGALFYFLLPAKWLDQLAAALCIERQTEQLRSDTIRQIEQNASEQMTEMGNLIKGFSGMFEPPAHEDDAVVRWTVQAALSVCRGCRERSDCWMDAKSMQQTLLCLAEQADAGNRVTTVDPLHPTCPRFGALCGAIVLSYRQALSKEAVLSEAQRQSQFANKQFSGVGDALLDRAKEIGTRAHEQTESRRRVEERLNELGVRMQSFDWTESEQNRVIRVVLQRPLHTKRDVIGTEIEKACGFRLRTVSVSVERQTVTFVLEQDANMHASVRVAKAEENGAVSGDATGECRLLGGRVCYALSDGMGRGGEARSESEAAIDLLFRLYRAGMERELVCDTVNRMLLARSEAEMYATLDAVSIDLNTGEAEILKYGAPPSYLLRGDSILPIDGEALPCGILLEAKPSVIHLQLKPNDRLVLCTDGVQDVLPEGAKETLKSLVKSRLPLDETLLKLAQSRRGTDDMTVMVIHVA